MPFPLKGGRCPEGGWGCPTMSCNPNIKLAQKLRCEATEVEKILWSYLRHKSLNGLRFRRQHPMGPFIVDFVCLKARVVIELDGSQHLEQEQKDRERDEWLSKQGYKVLRFYNNDFLQQREEVVEIIVEECVKRHPHPA